MIQVDMFEVQLGASLLVQFQTPEGDTVRVLADGGEGPRVRDIKAPLRAAMTGFGDGQERIHLLIGTHYDADHLDGLVPIIRDGNIAIEAAWLPPVANDVAQFNVDDDLDDEQFLAEQLCEYDTRGHRVLAHYLDAKDRVCALLRPTQSDPAQRVGVGSADVDELDHLRKQFVHYRDEALRELGTDTHVDPDEDSKRGRPSHADDASFEPMSLRELLRASGLLPWHRWFPGWRQHHLSFADSLQQLAQSSLRRVHPGSNAAVNLAHIRISAAKDAINAISLAHVVRALEDRGVPIQCQVIEDSTPRAFVWRHASKRFEAGSGLRTQGPVITVLGPSVGLVRKHWHRLPIGELARIALLSLYPIKGITPSNQLSYVVHIKAEGQGILVTGDAGCVDCSPGLRKPYSPALLQALAPLHVVQVAHHGGNNAHFAMNLSDVTDPSRHGTGPNRLHGWHFGPEHR